MQRIVDASLTVLRGTSTTQSHDTMNLHVLTAAPPPELARALARFEEQFTYPLGPGRFFRISHGDDYPRFFRAIGEVTCFVIERDGEVLGVLGLAITTLRTPTGDRLAVYLGDLKITPTARGGRVLPRLAEAGREYCSRVECGFSVVMDGTPVTPDRYTGRLGIPSFRAVAKVAVLRVPAVTGEWVSWQVADAAGFACFTALTTGMLGTSGGNAAERSESPPLWLVAPDGSACGRLEDTRRAKRLVADDGCEMVSAHLSCSGYRDPAALGELLRAASAAAAERGFPAVFAAVPPQHANVGIPGTVVAPATVYASGIEPGLSWVIHTAEI